MIRFLYLILFLLLPSWRSSSAGIQTAQKLSKSILPPPYDSLLKGKYLDMHCHVAGIGSGGSGCFLSPDIQSSYKFNLYLKAFGVTKDEIVKQGDGLIFDHIISGLEGSQSVGAAVILAMDGVIDKNGNLDTARTQVFVPNAYVLKYTQKFPRLLYGPSINPKRRDAILRLEQAKRDGAVLIKWIPSIQLFDPSDTAFTAFYLAMKRLNLPLLAHTGKESSFKTAQNELCDPQKLRLPLRLGVTVIAAHVATKGKNEGEDNMLRIVSMFPQYPNLYSEISSLTQVNKLGLLSKILEFPELNHRLMYGTDYPLIQTQLVSPYFFPLKLSIKQMQAIGKIKNPWDQDVALKKALGVQAEVFELSAKILIQAKPKQKTIAPVRKQKTKTRRSH